MASTMGVMKMFLKSGPKSPAIVVVAAVLLLPVLNVASADTTIATQKFSALTAPASGTAVEGNVQTQVFLFASTQADVPGGGPGADIFVIQTDTTTGQVVTQFFGSTPLEEGEFVIDRNLKSAKLVTTLSGSDSVSGADKTVTIEATWTGTGPTEATDDHSKTTFDGVVLVTHFVGKARDADVSIEISGDINIPNGSGSLLDLKSGSVQIST